MLDLQRIWINEYELAISVKSFWIKKFVYLFASLFKVTPSERNLVITFVSERLRPYFVDGQLKSYQIELVEQVSAHLTNCNFFSI